MENSQPSGSMSATWRFTPQRSHVFVTSLLLGGLLCFGVAFLFLWYDKAAAGYPMTIGLGLVVGAFVAWWISRRDVDLVDSAPTVIRAGRDGTELSTDSRMLTGRQQAQRLADLFAAVAGREALPKPDGLVTETGELVPNSSPAAEHRVDEINASVQAAGEEVLRLRSQRQQFASARELPASASPRLASNQIEQ